MRGNLWSFFGGVEVALETKVIIKLIAQQIAKCETAKEAYYCIQSAASDNEIDLPSFEEMRKGFAENQ
ncbi:MAG: hypothetical protein LBC86_10300 [Oscillospiraceae bacterium]|jgi:hypothetical protein|nr:hypothetical protein [Oscillospiraceae bacterium]